MFIQSLYNLSCTFTPKASGTVDAIGGVLNVDGTPVAFKGHIWLLEKGQERHSQGAEEVLSTHWMACPTSVAITEEGYVTEGTRVFDVIFSEDEHSLGHHLEVDLRLRS